jgi:Flp pilus assembly secretin CpaC
MLKVPLSAVAVATLQLLALERPVKIDRHLAEMRIISSDASSSHLKLGFKKAIVLDLSADIKDILVSDPATVNVIPRTARRVYIIGTGIGKANVFFYDEGGSEIAALDVSVSEIIPAQPAELGQGFRRSQHFPKGLRLRD